jgi:signal transduction histidine kinase
VELKLTPVSVRDVVADVTETFQTMAQEKGLRFLVQHEGKSAEIRADRDKLNQILTNLIHNAFKFTPEGGEVRVETRVPGEGCVEFCVADTGCGIPAHELSRVFERFYRGESVQADQRGAGLGLAITKSLVELHGGHIGVESTAGQGSRFHFTIPVSSRAPS